MNKDKYRFIIVGGDEPVFDYVYKQIKDLEYAYFDNHFPYNKFLTILYRIHFSSRINKIFPLPFQKLWIKKRMKLFEEKLAAMDADFRICFILFSNCLLYEKNRFSKMLKNRFPNARIVYYFQDLISRDKNKENFLKEYRQFVDIIYTFDQNDALKYQLQFHNLPYTDISDFYKNQEIRYDICFVGRAKNRLNDIILAYESLTRKGLRCLFYVIDAPQQEQREKDRIRYCKQISYEKYLEIIAHSKCILEIVQKNSTGNTLRVNEAIVLNKLLLSNNKALFDNSLYDFRYMYIYNDINEISPEFIKNTIDIEYKNKERLSPKSFLTDIENMLNIVCS